MRAPETGAALGALMDAVPVSARGRVRRSARSAVLARLIFLFSVLAESMHEAKGVRRNAPVAAAAALSASAGIVAAYERRCRVLHLRGGRDRTAAGGKASKRRREVGRHRALEGSLAGEMEASRRKRAVRQHWTPGGTSIKHRCDAAHARNRRRARGAPPADSPDRHLRRPGDEEDGGQDEEKGTHTGTVDGEARSAKRRQREPDPWDVDPSNPMALWDAAAGGFGGPLQSSSDEEIDLAAILPDDDPDGGGRGGGKGRRAGVAAPEHDDDSDNGRAEGAADTGSMGDGSSVDVMGDEGRGVGTGESAEMESVTGLDGLDGMEGLDGSGDAAGGEGEVWVPELRKRVKNTKMIAGSGYALVEADERDDSSAPAAGQDRLGAGGSSADGGGDGGREAGGVATLGVLDADEDEFEGLRVHGVDCVMHRPSGVLVDEEGREIGVLDAAGGGLQVDKAKHAGSPFLLASPAAAAAAAAGVAGAGRGHSVGQSDAAEDGEAEDGEGDSKSVEQGEDKTSMAVVAGAGAGEEEEGRGKGGALRAKLRELLVSKAMGGAGGRQDTPRSAELQRFERDGFVTFRDDELPAVESMLRYDTRTSTWAADPEQLEDVFGGVEGGAGGERADAGEARQVAKVVQDVNEFFLAANLKMPAGGEGQKGGTRRGGVGAGGQGAAAVEREGPGKLREVGGRLDQVRSALQSLAITPLQSLAMR